MIGPILENMAVRADGIIVPVFININGCTNCQMLGFIAYARNVWTIHAYNYFNCSRR